MKIKTNLYLLSTIFVTMCVAIGFVVFYSLGQINKEVKISNSGSRLVKDIFELNIVTNEYAMHHEERMQKQWRIKYNSLYRELERIREMPLSTGYNFILKSIITDYKALGDLFTQLQNNIGRRRRLIEGDRPQVELARDVRIEKLLTDEIMIRSQAISTQAFKLSDMMQKRIYQVEYKTKLIILFSIIGFAVLSFFASFFNIRTLVRQIQKLIKGAELIGEGNLEHKISLKTENEMHQLANAFNKMSEDLKVSQKKLLSAKEYAENIVGTIREPLIVLDSDLHVVSADNSFYKTFKVLPKEAEGRSIYERGNRQLDIPELRKPLEDILPEKGKLVDYEVRNIVESIGKKTMLLNARQITREEEEEEEGKLILLAIEDITKRKQAEEEIKDLAKFPSENPNPVLRVEKNGTILFANNAGSIFLDYWGTQAGQSIPEEWHKHVKYVLRSGTSNNFEIECNNRIFSLSITRVGEEGYVNFYGLDITERKKAEEQIKASLKEKEVLLMEIHHRVKNNMQVIASLLKLQSEDIKDKHLLELFNESRYRIKSMALIHEDLYTSKDLASIDFEEYTRKLTGHLMTSFGVSTDRIRINININNISLGIDTAIPCGLIINELFTNSLKYAFPANRFDVDLKDKKGEICIDFHSNSSEYSLIFKDNGVGLPEEMDFLKVGTLGLDLVRTLVKQLKGAIELNRSGGTEFKIIFRVQPLIVRTANK